MYDPFFDYRPKWLHRIGYAVLAVMFILFFVLMAFNAMALEDELRDPVRAERAKFLNMEE